MDNSIAQGLSYIASKQHENGSFSSLSSASASFTNTKRYTPTFVTSLILQALASLSSSSEKIPIQKKAAAFLLNEKSPTWTWNYWSRKSKEFSTLRYPDDLDDTVGAVIGLYLFDSTIITPDALAHIVNQLTTVEVTEGGPYKTWLISESASKEWKDIDVGVNAHIAYMLLQQGVTLPHLTTFLKQAIDTTAIRSPYYPSVYPLIYYLSRLPLGRKRVLIKLLLAKRNAAGYWENPLYTALAIKSLDNLGYSIDKLTDAQTYLLQSQKNGAWEAYAFYTDPTIKGKQYVAGSPVLTTAYCLQALACFTQTKKNKEKKVQFEDIHSSIQKQFNTRIAHLSPLLQKNFFDIYQRILTQDLLHTIPLLPTFFSHAIQKDIPKEMLSLLGLANIYGWIAYTVYDDFLDGIGDRKLLSPATVSLREVTTIYIDTIQLPSFHDVFLKTMDTIDATNSWEVEYCRDITRIPDFTDLSVLAKKSVGHMLGPLAILYFLGFDETTKEYQATYTFFIHYLIAKQLDDDAHDVIDDLSKGQVTYPGSLILKKIPQKNITFPTDKIVLQTIFWEECIDIIAEKIQYHTEQARIAYQSCSLIKDSSFFEKLLNQHEQSAKKAIEGRDKMKKFLATFTE